MAKTVDELFLCAPVVASVTGKTDRAVDVNAPGGILPIEWRADGEVVLTGRTEAVTTVSG